MSVTASHLGRVRSAVALVVLLAAVGAVLALAIGFLVAVLSAAVSAGLGTD